MSDNDRMIHVTDKQLWRLVSNVAGAAVAEMPESPEVFPSDRIADAVRKVMAEYGFDSPPAGYQS